MNLADLEKSFWGGQREQPTRVRLARVVRALRDEVRVIHVDQFSMEKLFDEILAGAGEEKVAGGSTREDEKAVEAVGDKGPVSVNSPAAAFFDFEAHLSHQAVWSEATFGPGERRAGVSDHIRKELLEVQAAYPGLARQLEWIDVVILALDGAWRSGMSPRQIIDGIVAKQRKNEGRTWPDWRTADPSKAIEHDRAKDAPAAGFFVERTPELDAMFDAPAADVCTWSHPKPGPIGQLVEYERSTCGKPEWLSGGSRETKCQCGREVYVDYNDPANVMLLRPRS